MNAKRAPASESLKLITHVSVRVLTLEMMLAIKGSPRPDEVGGAKDRADLAALRRLSRATSEPVIDPRRGVRESQHRAACVPP